MSTAVPNDYYREPRPEMVSFLPEHYTNVLEVGCGEGGFAANLRPGCETWAVEPVASAAKMAERRYARVLRGTFAGVHGQLPEAHFDLVICNDVIEHMPDVDWFLATVRGKMKKGAHLVGSVPNVRYYGNLYGLLLRKDWRYADHGILDRSHLRFFTERSLRRAILVGGFDLDIVRGINSCLVEPASFRHFAGAAMTVLAIAATLGYYADIRFLQFGFRIRNPEFPRT